MSQSPISQPVRHPHESGYKPDEPDARDFVFASLMVSGGLTPPTPDQGYETVLWKPDPLIKPTLDLKDLSTNSPGVYDQGMYMQSCVANAVAMAACYAWQKKPGEDQDRITGTGSRLFNPSRWWVWYHARRLDSPGSEHRNEGCSIRSAIKTLYERGCPADSVWPYPTLNSDYRPDVPWDVLQNALKADPTDNMYDVAKQNFMNDFNYYSIKTIGLDSDWSWNGDVEPPAEASDRVIQMRTALAEGYPIIFAIGEYYVWDTQDRNNTTGRWNKLFSPMWDQTNYTVGNIQGGQPDYDVIMNDLDPGFFPIDKPRLEIGARQYGHVLIVIGSDAKRELFLCQNSYGLFDNDMARNVAAKPYLWIPYNYFRTKLIDATWVITDKNAGPGPGPGPGPQPPQPPQPGVTVSVNFSDNMSGANVTKDVPANVGPQSLADLLSGTNVGKQGFFTSIQLRGAKPTAVASVVVGAKVLGTAKGQGGDYAQFARTPVSGAFIDVKV